jgi:hypothetical protein
MFEIVVSCVGITEQTAQAGIEDLLAEFSERPWHSAVICHWDGSRIVLQARNDYDATGQALLDEFSDSVCACLPIEDAAISFAVESVVTVADANG